MSDDRQRADRPEPSNPGTTVTLSDGTGSYCQDGHVPVVLNPPSSCPQCRGDDPIGDLWCPVCEFCCGC